MANKEWPPCQVCGKAVSTEQGVLTVYKKELDQFEKEHQEWEMKHPPDKSDVIRWWEAPKSVPWHWGHAECLRDGMYDIDYSRFDSAAKALSWTLHLMEKEWVQETDWEAAVRIHHKVVDV
ncbi:MAG: hypothetical protein HYX85_00760 [Chloroflexi bacterium]|nr:hypothetical protein [Chloroflexota bacterium]